MDAVGQELIQWLVNQGIGVAIAVYVLVRVDTRVGELLLAVQKLSDQLAQRAIA